MLQRLFDAVVWLLSPVGLVLFLTMVLPASVAALVAVFDLWSIWRLARGPNQSGRSGACSPPSGGGRT